MWKISRASNKEVPNQNRTQTSWTLSRRSIHWAAITNGAQGHITEFFFLSRLRHFDIFVLHILFLSTTLAAVLYFVLWHCIVDLGARPLFWRSCVWLSPGNISLSHARDVLIISPFTEVMFYLSTPHNHLNAKWVLLPGKTSGWPGRREWCWERLEQYSSFLFL